MLLRVFTLAFSASREGFPSEILESFAAHNQILEVWPHLFEHEGLPHWTVLVAYRPGGTDAVAAGAEEKLKKKGEDWREVLTDDDLPQFRALKTWRNELAREQGIPPYLIATNHQLAEIARDRPSSLEQLKSVQGFGPARLEKYGKTIVDLLTFVRTKRRAPGAAGRAGSVPVSNAAPGHLIVTSKICLRTTGVSGRMLRGWGRASLGPIRTL